MFFNEDSSLSYSLDSLLIIPIDEYFLSSHGLFVKIPYFPYDSEL